MPRWYRLLVLRAAQSISGAFLIVAGIIGLCIVADWGAHLGWGYSWWSAVVLVLCALIAIAIYRATASAIKKSK